MEGVGSGTVTEAQEWARPRPPAASLEDGCVTNKAGQSAYAIYYPKQAPPAEQGLPDP
jgi:hypothetical protein